MGRKAKRTLPTYTLEEAVRMRLLQVEVRGPGNGVTSRLQLRLTKLTDEPFQLRIAPGTEFVPIYALVEDALEGEASR